MAEPGTHGPSPLQRHFTEPTTPYWQSIVSADPSAAPSGPWQFGYPARLPDGRVLRLPIRQLGADPTQAVASLLVNHAAMPVVQTLGEMLAQALGPYKPDLLVGLPTLGLSLAPIVAAALGHTRFLPMGYSRKFWYDDTLSTPVQSITSPTPGKRIYLDPNLLPLLAGQRLVIIDDALSTGTTMAAAWDLVTALGGNVVGCGVAMCQGRRWADRLGPVRSASVAKVFDSPLLQAVPEGWVVRA